MKKLKSKTLTFICLVIVLAMFTAVCVCTAASVDFDSQVDAQKTFINGSVSVDGGEWTDTAPGKTAHTEFHTLRVKGSLSNRLEENQVLIISAANAWFTLKADGKTVASNYRDDDGIFADTPGYTIIYVSEKDISENSIVELNITDPYKFVSNEKLDDYFDMYVGNEATVYQLLFQHKSLTIIFCLLICFFGLFAFPVAGIILGGIDYRYLAFAALSFFAGIYISVSSVYSYLPLWIDRPALCMIINEAAGYFFVAAILIYMKTGFTIDSNKAAANIMTVIFIITVIAAGILQFTGVCDLFAFKPVFYLFFIICAVIMSVCIFREVRQKKRTVTDVIFNWVPIAACLAFDIINAFAGFTDFRATEFGIAVTIVYQIVCLVMLLKRQYKEQIRYQQMQKELYEAKVSIMVSQIQPHFLYNSLTSIAMLCTKDPQTAKTATINFADYMRENMNSLKESNPVPFTQELEHLKKYLMLEQLRFGDMLNIEYDIKTTDFYLPQLSVQPLVENAVKHGVGMKENGGTVKIATKDEDDCFKVIITDDGVGFDPNAVKNDGRSHVGMENVKQRLKDMVGGKVVITSEIGKGTTSEIIIPKEDKQ